jgi:hypothetical protein
MKNSEPEMLDQNIQRAAGVNALRKIGAIVEEERRLDKEKSRVLRWFVRYGWMVLSGFAVLLAYLTGVI